MRIILVLIVVAAVLDTVSGCSTSPHETTGGSNLSLAEYQAASRHSFCSRWVACDQFIDMATCEGLTSSGMGTLETALMRGTTTYDPVAAGACARTPVPTTCDYYQDTPTPGDPCQRVFMGTVPEGGTCIDNFECANGAGCGIDTSKCRADTSCCLGTCGEPRLVRPLGADCASPGGECEAGTICDNGVCSPLRKEGESCLAGGVWCMRGLVCLGSDHFGTCRVPAARGGDCAAAPCRDSRDYCASATMKCTARKLPGGSCPTTVDPNTPWVADTECVGYARCVAGTCVADRPNGEACTANVDCGSGYCGSGVCAFRPEGAPCVPW